MKFWLLGLFLVGGCKEEPTIVITFAPQDLSARPRDLAQAARAADMAPTGDACKSDGDCALIQAGCCDCNHGGSKISVGKAGAAKREALELVKCGGKQNGGIFCAEVVTNDASCSAEAACVDGRCGMRAKRK